ncbi:MAG TPA: aromatic ring-hydroxylating dioxygenase subunit alpha, partial [Dehalococcoidia bacterium]|nr:aromatic ring-hydroxylating dioxygenase subunit alpha [Dehalococcoidia bacterium]
LERERLFGCSWLVVGHDEMIPRPGDYVTNYMGEVPVILARDAEGQIHVLVNRCVHRGNQVCLFDRGNAPSFTCSYHGWTYDTTGKLTAVPLEQELYRGELDKGANGLEEVPRVANFKGLIFASFDPSAPPLEQWLGEDVCWWLKTFVLAEHLGGLQMMPGWHRYQSPGNWKLHAENYIGDDYHVFAATHVSWFRVVGQMLSEGVRSRALASPGGRISGPRYEGSVGAGYGDGPPFGMGMVVLDDSVYQFDKEEAKQLGPEAVEWVEERQRRLQDVLKESELKPYSFMNGLLFPNLGLMGFYSAIYGRHFLLFHPKGPWEHEVWQWTMVEKEAPKAVKELAVERVYRGQHMAGTIGQDDVENFERLTEMMRPSRNWQRPFHYGLQLGHESEGPRGLPGNIGPNPSEVNQRQFYRFWLQLMERG